MLVTTVLLLASAAAAQQESPQASFRDVLDVTVTNLDVVVVDRQGKPITGLSRDDFQLFEHEKERVKPEYFAEAGGGPTEPVWLVILIDEYNMRAANRDHALAVMRPGLESLLRSQQLPAMVATLDGAFVMLQEFTKDADAVLAALDGRVGQPATGDRLEGYERAARTTIADAMRQARSTAGSDRVAAMASIDGVMAELEGFGRRQFQDVGVTLQALSAFARSMAVVPGRKAVVYLTDGLAIQPADSALKTIQTLTTGGAGRGGEIVESQAGQGGDSSAFSAGVMRRDTSMEVSRLQQKVEPFNSVEGFRALVALANTYRVTFYPIKAPPGNAAAAQARTQGGSGLEISDLREALEYLANGTGGEAFTSDATGIDLLPDLASDFDHYYSLGISAKGKTDGEYVPIRIKVKQKGARVRYPEGYIHREFWGRLADRTVGGMVIGIEDNPHGMEASVVEQQAAAEDGLVDVQIGLELPIGAIGLAEEGGVQSAQANLAVAVLDAEGTLVAGRQLEMPLQIPATELEAAREQYYRAGVNLRLAPGEYHVGLGLWDRIAGYGSFINEVLTVAPP